MIREIGFSIAICTFKRPVLLRRALNSLVYQLLEFPMDYELLVVDNDSRDDTITEIVESLRHLGVSINLITEIKPGISNVRNRALMEAKYPYLLFIDDDAWVGDNWLINIVSPVLKNNSSFQCIVGPVKLVWEGDGKPSWFPDKYESLLCEYNMGNDSRYLTSNGYLLTTNVLFDVNVLRTIGGFRVNLGRIGGIPLGGEDNEIFQRLYKNNFKVWYQADALVFHPVPVERQRESYLIERLFWDGASQPLLNDNPINKFILFRKILYEYRNILSLMLRPLTKRSAFTLDNKLEISQRRGKVFMYSKILKKKIIGVSCTSALPH